MSGFQRVVVGPFLVAALVVVGLATSSSVSATEASLVAHPVRTVWADDIAGVEFAKVAGVAYRADTDELVITAGRQSEFSRFEVDFDARVTSSRPVPVGIDPTKAFDPITGEPVVAIDTPFGISAVRVSDSLTYVLSEDDQTLSAIDGAGATTATYDMGGVDLRDPVSMTFAPSSDPTDDPTIFNLFIADAGEADGTFSGVTEVSLEQVTLAAATMEDAHLVAVTDTSVWNPASPDPAGVTYYPPRDSLIVVDSEVDEVTGAGYNGVNLWESTLTGSVTDTGTLFPAVSKEPTGADYVPSTGQMFVTDDSVNKIDIITAGVDGRFGTADDGVDFIDAAAYGSTDVEDPAYHIATGHLFQLDGVAREIYRIDPVDGIFANGNDVVTSIDISFLGPTDFEGLAIDQTSGTLFAGARSNGRIYEITIDGTHLRTIDANGIVGLEFISGLAYAPASNGSGNFNFYVVDRGVDNAADPNENDGQIFELQLDTTDPVVSSVAPANGEVVPAGLTDVVAQVSDSESGVDRVRIYVRKLSTGEYWNGSAWVPAWSWVLATDSGAGTWTLPGVDASDAGNYKVLVWAWDVVGNRANFDANPQPVFSVASTDVTNPVVSSVAPANGEVVPAGLTDVVAQVSDAESGVDRVRIYVRKVSTGEYWNGSAWVPAWSWVLATDSGAGSWTLPGVDATDAGNYQVLIWAWDVAGNLASSAENPKPKFSVSSNDVTAPVVSSVTPVDGEVVPAGLTDVVAQVSDAESGVDRVRIHIQKTSTSEYWNGSAWVPAWSWVLATDSGAGAWTVPGVDATAPSDYRVLVWAWDVAGNRAGYDVNPQPVFSVVTDDVTAPVVSSVTPVNGAIVPAGLIDVVAQVSDTESAVDRVRIYVRKVSTGEYWNGSAWVANWSWVLATDSGADSWTLPGVDATDVGDYQVLVWAWDQANNVAPWNINPQPLFTSAN